LGYVLALASRASCHGTNVGGIANVTADAGLLIPGRDTTAERWKAECIATERKI
jgi:hypothetical protein